MAESIISYFRSEKSKYLIERLKEQNKMSDEQIEKACKLAKAHDFIKNFPNGYDTYIEQGGTNVSGGQKQRISIARALMKDASIVILDDSVSAVDVKTEKNILKNLSENRQGKTTILIAHRISTVENMDKIIFVEDGTVAAVGTHNELYSTNDEYRKMVQLQSLDDERTVNGNA